MNLGTGCPTSHSSCAVSLVLTPLSLTQSEALPAPLTTRVLWAPAPCFLLTGADGDFDPPAEPLPPGNTQGVSAAPAFVARPATLVSPFQMPGGDLIDTAHLFMRVQSCELLLGQLPRARQPWRGHKGPVLPVGAGVGPPLGQQRP